MKFKCPECDKTDEYPDITKENRKRMLAVCICGARFPAKKKFRVKSKGQKETAGKKSA